MKVFIVETGEYEQRGVAAVFDSAERAMAAFPGEWTLTYWRHHPLEPETYWREWGSAAAQIFESELVDDGPLAEVAPIIRQTYEPISGGWTYDAISAKEAELLKVT